MFELDENQEKVSKNFSEDSYLGRKKNTDRIYDWNTFYRKNMGRFVQHYLGLSLHLYQYIILFLMNLFPTICIVACRASAKSYLIAIFACAKAILYPHSQIVIASGTKEQASLIVSEKIKKELMRDSPNLCREILVIRDNKNEIEVIFRNGSSIVVVPASENARGHRSTCLILEEFRQIRKKIIDSVLSPFLIVRPTPFLKNKDYEKLVEEPIEIYISSSWYRSHWMWNILNVFLKDKFENDTSCVLAMDYSITLKHNIRTRKQLLKEKKKLDPISWAIEYGNQMIAENTHSYFTYTMMGSNQKISRAFYPRSNEDYSPHSKNKNMIPKQDGEIRIISCDIAMIENNANDNSIFSCIRLLPETTKSSSENSQIGQKYRRQVPYMESHQGGETQFQAIRIKQLFEDFDADFCVLDGRNAGISIYDSLAKVLYDKDRDKEYKPWSCMNDDNLANRIKIPNSLEIVYVVIASLKLNSEIAVEMRTTLTDHNIDFLINKNDAIGELQQKFPEYLKTEDPEVQIYYEKPYLETTALIHEMINLEYEKLEQTGYIRISEQGNNRKDRYTSISYGNFFASLLERDLLNNSGSSDYDDMESCVSEIDF